MTKGGPFLVATPWSHHAGKRHPRPPAPQKDGLRPTAYSGAVWSARDTAYAAASATLRQCCIACHSFGSRPWFLANLGFRKERLSRLRARPELSSWSNSNLACRGVGLLAEARSVRWL